MSQIVITQADNGFVVEIRGNGINEIQVANKLSQVVKAVKATFQTETEEAE